MAYRQARARAILKIEETEELIKQLNDENEILLIEPDSYLLQINMFCVKQNNKYIRILNRLILEYSIINEFMLSTTYIV